MIEEVRIHDTRFQHPNLHELFCDEAMCKSVREPLGSGYEYFKQVSLQLKERVYGKIEKKQHSLVERQGLA
jgi:hypothetical protein